MVGRPQERPEEQPPVSREHSQQALGQPPRHDRNSKKKAPEQEGQSVTRPRASSLRGDLRKLNKGPRDGQVKLNSRPQRHQGTSAGGSPENDGHVPPKTPPKLRASTLRFDLRKLSEGSREGQVGLAPFSHVELRATTGNNGDVAPEMAPAYVSLTFEPAQGFSDDLLRETPTTFDPSPSNALDNTSLAAPPARPRKRPRQIKGVSSDDSGPAVPRKAPQGRQRARKPKATVNGSNSQNAVRDNTPVLHSQESLAPLPPPAPAPQASWNIRPGNDDAANDYVQTAIFPTSPSLQGADEEPVLALADFLRNHTTECSETNAQHSQSTHGEETCGATTVKRNKGLLPPPSFGPATRNNTIHLTFPNHETANRTIPSPNKNRDTPEQTHSQNSHHHPDNTHSLHTGVPPSTKPKSNQKVSTQKTPTSHTGNNNCKRKAAPLEQDQQEPPSTKRKQLRASTQAGQLPHTDVLETSVLLQLAQLP